MEWLVLDLRNLIKPVRQILLVVLHLLYDWLVDETTLDQQVQSLLVNIIITILRVEWVFNQ